MVTHVTRSAEPDDPVHDASLLPAMASELFGAEDSVCLARASLVTEAWRLHADQPAPLRRALATAHVLAHLPLDLASNPVFAGNTAVRPRAWAVVPECGFDIDPQALVEHDWLHADWLRERIPAQMLAFWEGRSTGGSAGTGHLAIDLEAVVQRGLRAILNDVLARQHEGAPEQRAYRQAMAVSLEAVIAWAHRYAAAADREAGVIADPRLAAAHRRVASACRHVPEFPARDLFEGLQAIVLVHLAMVLEGQGVSVSLGLPDRALARFAAQAEGEMDQAVEWCGAFLLKIAGNSYHGRFSKTQTITLGGADERGADQCGAVTLAFLRAFARVPVADPHCFLRWHSGLDPRVWRETLAMLSAGRSMPLLVNDHAVVPGLMDAGIARTDAWNYCIIGCNEVGIPGRACQTACCHGLYLNDLVLLDQVLRRDPPPRGADEAVAMFGDKVLEQARAGIVARRAWIVRKAERSPFPLTSALMHGPIAAGDDYQRAMQYPDVFAAYTRGTANAANALAAVQQRVWERREMTLTALLDRIDAGDEAVLAAMKSCPRWGCDDDRADRWAVELSGARAGALRQAAVEAGLPGILCCHVVRSLHHVDGRAMGATADGRADGTPVADSIGAAPGDAVAGPTAMLNSVLRLDARTCYAGVYNLNLTLPGGAQSAPEVLRALCEAFFGDGGQELQINVLDSRKLRLARAHPEAFMDLVVRIAGLNARFIELSRQEQDELIARAEQAETFAG